MFSLDAVTLRPLEPSDADVTYGWHVDVELEIASGWVARRSKHAFARRLSAHLEEPPADLIVFGIEHDGRLVGRVDLALIDRTHARAMLGIFIGERAARRRGVARTALRMMCDYAFKVENLERVYAEVYAFNVPARALMERVGLVPEGVLRQHERHNGRRRDVHVFGIAVSEFYAKYPTIFPDPAG